MYNTLNEYKPFHHKSGTITPTSCGQPNEISEIAQSPVSVRVAREIIDRLVVTRSGNIDSKHLWVVIAWATHHKVQMTRNWLTMKVIYITLGLCSKTHFAVEQAHPQIRSKKTLLNTSRPTSASNGTATTSFFYRTTTA